MGPTEAPSARGAASAPRPPPGTACSLRLLAENTLTTSDMENLSDCTTETELGPPTWSHPSLGVSICKVGCHQDAARQGAGAVHDHRCVR